MPVRPGGPAARGGEQLRAEPRRAGRPAPERHAPGKAGGGRDGPVPEGRPGVGEGDLHPRALHAPGRQSRRAPGRLGPGVHRAPEVPGSRGPSRPGRGRRPVAPAGWPGRRVPGHTRVRVRRRIRLDAATAPGQRGRPAAVPTPSRPAAPPKRPNPGHGPDTLRPGPTPDQPCPHHAAGPQNAVHARSPQGAKNPRLDTRILIYREQKNKKKIT